MPGIPAIPSVPGNLPGIPSPAQGVPASPDLLTGLLQAAPSAMQGYEQGVEAKKQRREQAMQDLQQLAPYAAQDPTNPATIKAVQKAFKQMGLNPAAVVDQNGHLNNEALLQFNPYFNMFAQVAANPNADPAVRDWLAKKVGISDFPVGGGYLPKPLQEQVDKFHTLLKGVGGAGGLAPQEVMQLGSNLAQQLQASGYGQQAQGILQEANAAATPTEGTQAKIGATKASTQRSQAGTGLINEQRKLAAVNTLNAELKSGLIHAQTIVEMHRVGLIDSQAAAASAHASAALMNAQTNAGRLQVEMARLSSTNLKTALDAVKNYNSSVAGLQGHIDALTNQKVSLTNQGNWMSSDGKLTPAALTIQHQLTQLQQLQQKMKPISEDAVTAAAMKNAGLPSTQKILPSTQKSLPSAQKILPNNKPQTGSKGTISMKDLVSIARKYKKSVQQVKKDYETQGYTVKP